MSAAVVNFQTTFSNENQGSRFKRINVPIIFGYARLRLFIMSTNSFRDLDNLGLKAFSSATVVTVLPE